MVKFLLDKETRTELAKDHLIGGWSLSKCAEEYGVSKTTALRYVNTYRKGRDKSGRYASGRVRYVHKPKPKLQPCGTDAAYQRHKRQGQYPCTACLAAHALKVKNYKERKRDAA